MLKHGSHSALKEKQTYLDIPEEVKSELAENSLTTEQFEMNNDEVWHPNIRLTRIQTGDKATPSQYLDSRSGNSPFPSFLQLQSSKESSKSLALDLKSFYENYNTKKGNSFDQFQDLGCACKFLKATLQDSLTDDFSEIKLTQMPSPAVEKTPFSTFSHCNL